MKRLQPPKVSVEESHLANFQPAAFCSSFSPLNMTSEPPPIGTALRTFLGTKATP